MWARCVSALESSASKWVSSSDLQVEADHSVLLQTWPRTVSLCGGCKLDGVTEDAAGFLMFRLCCNPVADSPSWKG